jgi:uncharacterized protein YcnI
MRLGRSIIATALTSLALTLVVPATALAHVVVKPTQAVTGAFTTFTVGTPNEKAVAVTELRLVLPGDLKEVSPTVHAGWTITTEKSGESVTSISWSGGTIPAGQRDDFSFSAQTPAKPGDLVWKAYQTYADGSTVSWDQKPTNGESESESSGPYSVTHVTATDPQASAAAKADTSEGSNTLPLVISLAALVLSVLALASQRKGVAKK